MVNLPHNCKSQEVICLCHHHRLQEKYDLHTIRGNLEQDKMEDSLVTILLH